MSDYYKPHRKPDWNYGGPNWKLSRSKIDLFLECPRCFYIDNKLGVARPRGPGFSLNIAVGDLLRKEFDIHRAKGTAHPFMKSYKIDAIPFKHGEMDAWRHNFTGVQHKHRETGLLVTGAPDDVWIDSKDELLVVDYKSTAKEGRIESLEDSGWSKQYRRQLEVYQWLLRRNGFPVSNQCYLVYVNGKKDAAAFDGKLEFDVTLIPIVGNDGWIQDTLLAIKKCLEDDALPGSAVECDYCKYRKATAEATSNAIAKSKPVTSRASKHLEPTSGNASLF